jgi:hypothetical protein
MAPPGIRVYAQTILSRSLGENIMTRFDQRVGALWSRGRAGVTAASTQWRRQRPTALSNVRPLIANDLRVGL